MAREDVYYIRNFDSDKTGCLANCESLPGNACRKRAKSEVGACTDGINNNGLGYDADGFIDCDDASCWDDPACLSTTPAPVTTPSPATPAPTPLPVTPVPTPVTPAPVLSTPAPVAPAASCSCSQTHSALVWLGPTAVQQLTESISTAARTSSRLVQLLLQPYHQHQMQGILAQVTHNVTASI